MSFPTNPGPIIGAGRQSITEGFASQPNLAGVMSGWCRPITLVTVREIITSGGLVERDERQVETFGMKQPMPEKLVIQKDGDRSWRWHILNTTTCLRVKTNDIVIIQGDRYKVMTARDYSENGFYEHELIEDFQNA